jgi:Yip1 domain.
MEYIELIKGFFLSPVETFRKVKDTDYGDTLVYFLVLAIVYAILSVPVMLVTLPLTWFTGIYGLPGIGMLSGFGIVLIAVMMIIAGLVFLFIGAAWLHLWVYLFGGRNGYRETLKALAFGGTPALLLGWIPLVGMLAVIWSLVLTFLGVRELQGISSARALGAVILAVVIPLILLVLLAAIFFVAYTQTGPVLTAVS